MHQFQGRDCQNPNNSPYILCKKPTLNAKAGILEVNEWKNIYHVNTNQKKAGVAILILTKANIRERKIIKG